LNFFCNISDSVYKLFEWKDLMLFGLRECKVQCAWFVHMNNTSTFFSAALFLYLYFSADLTRTNGVITVYDIFVMPHSFSVYFMNRTGSCCNFCSREAAIIVLLTITCCHFFLINFCHENLVDCFGYRLIRIGYATVL